MGLSARELTPEMVKKIAVSGAEARSFKRAAIVLREVGGVRTPAKTVERIVHEASCKSAPPRCATTTGW